MSNARARRHCFTWFPATPEEGEDSEAFAVPYFLPDPPLPSGARYFLGGFEVCPDTGRPHIQGYVEWTSAKTIRAAVSALSPPGVHVEVCRGSAKQNREYCKKDDDYVEIGEPSSQGSRTDIEAVKTAVDNGASIREIAEEHFEPFLRYGKGIREYKRLVTPPRDWPMELILYIGPTGTNKSRSAHEAYPGAFWKPHKAEWWDGYDGQETVIFDEFYGHRFSFTELLRLTDRYPYAVQVKGSYVEFTSKRIVFTSNQEPEDWYDSEKTHQGPWELNPLNRRIRQYGKIIRTGEVHRVQRAPPPLPGYDDPRPHEDLGGAQVMDLSDGEVPDSVFDGIFPPENFSE